MLDLDLGSRVVAIRIGLAVAIRATARQDRLDRFTRLDKLSIYQRRFPTPVAVESVVIDRGVELSVRRVHKAASGCHEHGARAVCQLLANPGKSDI